MYETTGRKVVVLVDEYDKPLLGTMDNMAINNEIRMALKGFKQQGRKALSNRFLPAVQIVGRICPNGSE
jgi:hypothetical protein